MTDHPVSPQDGGRRAQNSNARQDACPFICAPVTQVRERSAGMGEDDRHCSLEHQVDGDRR
jgi:hypothetical protein